MRKRGAKAEMVATNTKDVVVNLALEQNCAREGPLRKRSLSSFCKSSVRTTAFGLFTALFALAGFGKHLALDKGAWQHGKFDLDRRRNLAFSD